MAAGLLNKPFDDLWQRDRRARRERRWLGTVVFGVPGFVALLAATVWAATQTTGYSPPGVLRVTAERVLYTFGVSDIPEPEMLKIESGEFLMGETPEKAMFSFGVPQHPVSVGNFAIGRYEVTFNEYDYFVKQARIREPSDGSFGRGRRPVMGVSWNEVQAYIRWLRFVRGKSYRLPTEAE